MVAPVPWVPAPLARSARYAGHAATPARETRHGIEIEARLGMFLAMLKAPIEREIGKELDKRFA